jgi:hypothetical protein
MADSFIDKMTSGKPVVNEGEKSQNTMLISLTAEKSTLSQLLILSHYLTSIFKLSTMGVSNLWKVCIGFF